MEDEMTKEKEWIQNWSKDLTSSIPFGSGYLDINLTKNRYILLNLTVRYIILTKTYLFNSCPPSTLSRIKRNFL
jgi:hypothetical protein